MQRALLPSEESSAQGIGNGELFADSDHGGILDFLMAGVWCWFVAPQPCNSHYVSREAICIRGSPGAYQV